MAAAAKESRAEQKVGTSELLLLLAAGGEVPLSECLERCGEATLALAWMRGEVEFGRTKYVTTGNPASPVTVHNGVSLPAPAVIIEGGLEWSGPKQRWHGTLARVTAEALPKYSRYQKYQLEVCVNKEKDVWEWLEEGKPANGRETRYARRDIDRDEAERLFELRVQLTEKGAAALAD